MHWRPASGIWYLRLMSYVSLYRKWRPQSFSQLVGQDHIAKTLANSIEADRVAHAYLFAGPRGTGKTSSAKILAKSVNCDQGPTPEPCGKCQSCLEIVVGSSLDVIEMDAASNRGIDEIRDLRDKVAFAAAAGRRKVYIIDEVHMLTEPAFNALLKTLEEPPPHVIFVLATTDPNKVPNTIASRCQHFEFRRIPTAALIGRLTLIAEAEKILIQSDALKVIARQAEGGLRDAIGMLDQLSVYTDKEITPDDVTTFLGLVDSALVEKVIDLMISADIPGVFELVDSLIETGRDIRQFAAALLAYFRDMFVLMYVTEPENRRRLVDHSDEVIERLLSQAQTLGAEKIRSALTEVGRLYESLRTAAEPRLALELALIFLIKGGELTIEALARRLARLEGGQAPSSFEPVRPAPARMAPPRETTRPTVPPSNGAPKKAPPGAGPVDLERVKSAWGDILDRAKAKKLSLYAFLIEGYPDELAGGSLKVAFPSDTFTRRELGKESNAKIFKEALSEVLGCELSFETVVKEGGSARQTEAPKAPAAPKTESPPPAAVAAGSEDDSVLDLLKESFGAEVVDETAVD